VKKAHLPIASNERAFKNVALDRAGDDPAPNGFAPTYCLSTLPLADSSRASHLDLFD